MKNLFLLITIILNCSILFAQEVVSSAGETQTASGYEVSWTIGEPVIETISSGDNTLTQGFHQSKLIITAVTELLFSGIDVKVFPNPTQDLVNIQFNEWIENSGYSLFDMTGKKLNQKNIESKDTQLDLKNYVSGTYFLQLYSEGKHPLQTFKIIKK